MEAAGFPAVLHERHHLREPGRRPPGALPSPFSFLLPWLVGPPHSPLRGVPLPFNPRGCLSALAASPCGPLRRLLQIKNSGEKTLRYISVVSEPPISINVYKDWSTCDDTVCKDENTIVDDTESVSPTWWDRKYAAAGGYDSYMRRVRKAAKKQAEEAAKKAEL